MCGLFLVQLSFSFRESSATFTDLSLFTVFTTGDTKDLHTHHLSFPNVRIHSVSLVRVLHLLVDVEVPVWLLFVFG